MIRQLFEQQYRSGLIRDEDRIKAVPDVRTNSIVVSTSGRSFELFEDLLARLDVEVPVDFREIRIIELANASASRLAPMIQSLMDARLERLRRVQPETAELEQAVIMSDARSNALVVPQARRPEMQSGEFDGGVSTPQPPPRSPPPPPFL